MDKIVISNIPPYDGEHDFDSSYFTNRELHTIKRLTGVRAGELNDALRAGDTDLLIALTVIALERLNKPVNEEAFWNANVGDITFVPGEEPDADPPAETPPASPASESESGVSSGNDSTVSSEKPESSPSSTGSPDLGTGADSDPEISAS